MALFNYPTSTWIATANVFRLIIFYIGLVGNTIFLLIVSVTRFKCFLPKALLITQAISDACTCLIAILFVHLDHTLKYDSGVTNVLFCRMWVTNFPFFIALSFSLFNMMALCTDRYLALVHPTKYLDRINLRLALTYCAIVTIVIASNIGIGFQMKLVDDRCVSINTKFVLANASIWTAMNFFIPVIIYVFMYWRIRSAAKEKRANSGKLYDRLTLSILVTVATQIVLIAPDPLYFVIGNLADIAYDVGSPVQTWTASMLVINSCVMPYLMFALLKKLHHVFKPLSACLSTKKEQSQSEQSSIDCDGHTSVAMP